MQDGGILPQPTRVKIAVLLIHHFHPWELNQKNPVSFKAIIFIKTYLPVLKPSNTQRTFTSFLQWIPFNSFEWHLCSSWNHGHSECQQMSDLTIPQFISTKVTELEIQNIKSVFHFHLKMYDPINPIAGTCNGTNFDVDVLNCYDFNPIAFKLLQCNFFT